MDAVIERELPAFVAHEARLLDAGRLDEWLQRFAEDGRYWVPLQGAVQADDGAGRYELHTPFVYIESRGGQQIVLAGNARHSLVRGAAGTRIRLKRVDLLDAGAALPAIQLFP